MFSFDMIPGNVNLRSRDFHGESYYDIQALTADQRFRDSMRLIQRYSLLPIMTLGQFFYPLVVLEFYHTMTSRGAPNHLQLQFSIDGHPRVLRAADITTALDLPVVLVNSTDYWQWPQPSPREMVRSLARDTTNGPILFRRQLSLQMLLADHVLRTNMFPLQHYVQRRGAILEALYRISEGFWFSPAELVMTKLLHFEEKVHRKDLARAEAIPLLMPRLPCQVLGHLGFSEEPRIEWRLSYPLVLSLERSLSIPLSFILKQQEEVEGDYAEDLPRGEQPVPEVEVERTSVLDLSPLVPPLTAPAPPETAGPSSTSKEPSKHILGTSTDFFAVLDVVTALTERMARAEVTLMQNHAMLL